MLTREQFRKQKNNDKRKVNKQKRQKANIIIRVLIGIVLAVYYLIKGINTIVLYLFNLLPKVVKMTIIYSLIALSILEIVNIKNPQVKTIIQEKIVEVEKVIAMETENEKVENESKEIVEEQNYTFKSKHEQNIYNKSIEKGLTHNQALLLISISRHETGYWSSENFLNKNNFGGIMCNDGTKIVTYKSYEEGLNAFINLLKNHYFAKGLNSIEEIGKIYCPVGAANDPKGLNKYWVGNVTKFYNDYLASYPLEK